MITVTVKNTEKLMADLRKAGADVQEEARAILKEQADRIRDDAKRRCPVDTGAMRDSIRSSVSKKTLDAYISAGGVVRGTDTYYAQFVEFGTKSVPARPFLFPSGRAKEEETMAKLTAMMTAKLSKAVEGNGI